MFRYVTLISALAVLATASLGQQPIGDTGRRGYEIGPGDKISGKVLGEAEFNFDSIVDEDGKIQVPFASEGILAACKTEKELRLEVSKYLQKYLKTPQLSVNVVERNRPPATIYGEVWNPQKVVLSRPATLLEIVSFSGGLKPEASGSIQVTRTMRLTCSEPAADNWKMGEGDTLGFPSRVFSFSKLRENNPAVYPGDIISIQKSPPVYIVGEVYRPGPVLMPEGNLPLMQAIAMAGGTGREAKIKSVRIFRQKPGTSEPEMTIVDLTEYRKGGKEDMLLQPYDIVEVGKNPKSIAQTLLEIATGGVQSAANNLPIRVIY